MSLKKSLKLNKLQTRTLALLQELAEQSDLASRNEETGDVTIFGMPHAHGDHMHIGRFTVSSRFASGLNNVNVRTALERRGLAVQAKGTDYPSSITITAAGLAYDTGIRRDMLEESDH